MNGSSPRTHPDEAVRVLLVDDDADVRQEMAEAMAMAGLRVDTAASAAAGMAMLNAVDDIAVVVTDLRMADGDGLAFARTIRDTLGPPERIGIIVLSGHGLAEATAKAAELRLHGVVRKPARLAQLVALVRQAARIARQFATVA